MSFHVRLGMSSLWRLHTKKNIIQDYSLEHRTPLDTILDAINDSCR